MFVYFGSIKYTDEVELTVLLILIISQIIITVLMLYTNNLKASVIFISVVIGAIRWVLYVVCDALYNAYVAYKFKQILGIL